jgi:hypothetical protein
VVDRPGALGEDLRAGREALELGRRRDVPELDGLERVERRMGAEEVRDLLDTGRPSDVSVHRTLRRLGAAVMRGSGHRRGTPYPSGAHISTGRIGVLTLTVRAIVECRDPSKSVAVGRDADVAHGPRIGWLTCHIRRDISMA